MTMKSPSFHRSTSGVLDFDSVLRLSKLQTKCMNVFDYECIFQDNNSEAVGRTK